MSLELISTSMPGPEMVREHLTHAMNRSGATVALGDLMGLDLAGTTAESIAGQGVGGLTGLGAAEAAYHNAVNPSAGTLTVARWYGVVSSLLDGAGADNTEVELTLSGLVTAKVNGTDFTRSQLLRAGATAANRELAIHGDLSGARPVGWIHDPVDASVTAQTTKIIFYGSAGVIGGGNT